ncbi:hypothetical protein [Sphingomonas sp. CFBP 13733]|uniref:hypothetical protein n=1 Tax=Sphingomonas sp. CFBP 13733 TaxID=2775291 RepID=UPI001784837A|nr:hypothetical protein [Sphingomonas sp. CFBP 13733]MBD8640268.1 hypothetical protein [Sphingomonas sp. CFBP 13733]
MVERDYDEILPWGHWMRVKPGTVSTILVDEDGREWRSLREALFRGRLGFKNVSLFFREVELERMLAYLLAAGGLLRSGSHRYAGIELLKDDQFRLFYPHWLASQGLLEGDDHRPPVHESKMTKEGHSIAKMLLATRPPELAPFHPGVESILFALGKAEEIRRPAFERGDQDLGQMKFAFVRERIGQVPAISLLHRDAGTRMPLVRTIWVQTFADERSRDSYFAWLSRRLDMWNDWGEIAKRTSSAALTQELLSLLVCEMDDAAEDADDVHPEGKRDDGEAPPFLSIEYRKP